MAVRGTRGRGGLHRGVASKSKKEPEEIQQRLDELAKLVDMTPGEAKFQQIIEEMKNVQGHIVSNPARGKYSIEYPQLRKKQEELDAFMKEEADRQIKELDDQLDSFRYDEIKGKPLSFQLQYWLSSAEFTAFVLFCFFSSGLFTWFRCSLDVYHFRLKSVEIEERFHQQVADLEKEILAVNQARIRSSSSLASKE